LYCLEAGDFDSVILSGYSYDQTLKSWIGGHFISKLCWRASRDGWSASVFHSNCDNKKPTVTIVKVGQYIFGGYATASWEGKINQSGLVNFFIYVYSQDFRILA
jgi:hypothetical protein